MRYEICWERHWSQTEGEKKSYRRKDKEVNILVVWFIISDSIMLKMNKTYIDDKKNILFW